MTGLFGRVPSGTGSRRANVRLRRSCRRGTAAAGREAAKRARDAGGRGGRQPTADDDVGGYEMITMIQMTLSYPL